MFTVKCPFIDLRREPRQAATDLSHDDNRETQLLYAEPVKILKPGKWCQVYAPLQDYSGYVLEEELARSVRPYRPTHVVIDQALYGALVERDDPVAKGLKKRPLAWNLQTMLNEARGFLNFPYLWGGCSGQAIDCSGLVHLLFRAQGIWVPRDAKDQMDVGYPIKKLRPGDALYLFKEGKRANHVVLAIDEMHCIEAPQTGEYVRLLKWGKSIQWQDEMIVIQGREPAYCAIKRFWSRPRSLSSAFV